MQASKCGKEEERRKKKRRRGHSEPRFDLLLRILQRPLAPRRATPHPIDLRPREPFRFDGGIIPGPGRTGDFRIDLLLSSLITRERVVVIVGRRSVGAAVGAPVDGHDAGAAEAEVVLQGY